MKFVACALVAIATICFSASSVDAGCFHKNSCCKVAKAKCCKVRKCCKPVKVKCCKPVKVHKCCEPCPVNGPCGC